MAWLPASRLEVVNEAEPELSVSVSMVVPPSLKVTVPVGVPYELVTVAVKVTLAPNVAGLAEDVKLVAEFALSTVRVKFWEASGLVPLLAPTVKL